MSIPWAKIIPVVRAYAPKVWDWWQRRKARKAAQAEQAERLAWMDKHEDGW